MIPRRKNIWTAITVALLMSFILCSCGSKKATDQNSSKPYNGFFDQSIVHQIEIQIDDSDLQDQRENPIEKTKYRVAVTIDGEKLEDVAFSTKGHFSLHNTARSGSYRYPFKFDFKKYNKDQTFYGLDKLNLSNLYADPSGMRNWLAFQIMGEAGIDAPLTSYVWLKINGEDMGLYLAIEEIGNSWMDRTGHKDGKLYKPEAETSEINIGGADDVRIIEEKGLLGFFMARIEQVGSPADSGAALVYINDDEASYPDIFNNAKTKVKDRDKERMIGSLKALNDPEKRHSALDTEEVIRYFAAHNFVLSADSYTGLSSHNFYVLEQDGALSMYPWDYDNAFGDTLTVLHPEMTQDDIINWAIDEPLFDVDPKERPMWAWIPEEDDDLARYHAVMDELVAGYFESGRFEKEIDTMHELIGPYQAKDPTAFFTPEVSQTGYQDLKAFCMGRTSCVRNQLDKK